ncbi:MAG: NAD(P)/FAD-dependent oxidoreductase [Anaerolineae bacterium]|nr:NAD(P)/FAD-dependent oxidoreductase [Anaerolineae bacterium]MDH7473296.1 NAD(P)/FAD-dependent oxidoreductase [Anaerolineae bacterium]
MNVGIVGGGIMGVSLGYFLSQQGVNVEIFEASPSLGGLANTVTLEDGVSVDRFYHTILSSDSHLRQLCTELNIADRLRFRETKMGFYHQGEIHSMNNIVEFLRFPPLGWIDRFRLGLTVLYAQFVRDWHRLEGTSVEEWLVRLSGQRTFENIWRPMLKAKFDGGFENTPATYIWARLVRMKSTRSGASQKEEAGHLIGGYMTLIEAMVEQIEAAGGKIHLRCPVQEIVIEQGRARGVRIGHEIYPFNAVVAALQVPIFRQLIPSAGQDYHDFLGKTDYLGVICPLLVLDRPLTGFWTLNITDDRVPFTGIIETTTYIDPEFVGGHHLVYLPKYIAPGSHWQQMSDEEIKETWLQHLETMFPHFDRRWVRYFLVHRERYVEPLHWLNSTHLIPQVKTPIENLYLATTAQIYPALTNSESVTRHARRMAQIILEESLTPVSWPTCVVRQAAVLDTVA